jgi:hypothetical protein
MYQCPQMITETIVRKANNADEQVAKVVDRVLNQVFGREATLLIYKHLERQYGVKRNEIGKKIDVFAQGLEDFLRSGAYVIEKRILGDIASSYGSLRKLEKPKIDDECNFVSQMKLYLHKA